MKKVVLINLSPRGNGTSAMLLDMCEDHLTKAEYIITSYNLYKYLDHMDDIISSIKEADIIVMCGPCYVNQFPADTISLLDNMINQPDIIHGQSLYGIIQGGMPYVHTHVSGIKTLELFCKECDMEFKGGFVMGLGAYLNGKSIDNLPNGKKVMKKFELFLKHMVNQEKSPNSLYESAQIKLPSFVYKVMAKGMNASIQKDLNAKGIDYKKPSPYLNQVK